jgi:hypothetical protein
MVFKSNQHSNPNQINLSFYDRRFNPVLESVSFGVLVHPSQTPTTYNITIKPRSPIADKFGSWDTSRPITEPGTLVEEYTINDPRRNPFRENLKLPPISVSPRREPTYLVIVLQKSSMSCNNMCDENNQNARNTIHEEHYDPLIYMKPKQKKYW